jgi:DNA-binding transcriptional ArsR family regulator
MNVEMRREIVEQGDAIGALSALAQDTRLSVFRQLVRAGPDGMNAGDIAAGVGANASTLSHHLGLLERAGLVRSRRAGRMVVYAADYEGTRKLLAFLMEDCCQGRPEICGSGLAGGATCSEEEKCS